VSGLTDAVVQMFVVVLRNGQHEQVDSCDDGSGDDDAENEHVEAKIAHGPSRATAEL
jgi:hypothetical protein